MRLQLPFLFVLLFSCAVSAQSETISWDECVRVAGAENPDLLSAQHSLRAAGRQVDAERGAYYPQLTAGVNSNYMNGAAGGGFGGGTNGTGMTGRANGTMTGSFDDDQTRHTGALSASQNIFAGFQTQAKVAAAAAKAEASGADLAAVKANVSRDLKYAFSQLLFSQRYIELTKNIIARREENLRLVELRYESGAENKGSLLLSQASLEDARFDELQARNALAVGQQQLARVLGREAAEGLLISGAVPVEELSGRVDFMGLVRSIPGWLLAAAQKRNAAAQVETARSAFYPSVDSRGSVEREAGASAPKREGVSVGLSVSYPLFTGGRDSSVLAGAVASDSAAAENLRSVERQLLVQLKQAHAAFAEAVVRAKVDRSFVQAAQVRAEIARAKYNNGLLSFEDWDIIENDLITRQKTSLQSERQRITAAADWEQVQGKGVIQ